MRSSIGGDFLVVDGAAGSLLIRAEHVVIESPRLDLRVPIGSRVAAPDAGSVGAPSVVLDLEPMYPEANDGALDEAPPDRARR